MMKRTQRAFTLIELLVVIAIIAILVALLLPAVQQVREAARKSQCQDHLHNWAIALHSYEGAHRTLPYGAMNIPNSAANPANNFGWHVMVLPFVEQKPLYDQFNFNLHYDDNSTTPVSNVLLKRQSFELMFCPSGTKQFNQGSTTEFTVHYRGIAGAKGPLPPSHPRFNAMANCTTGAWSATAPAGCYAGVGTGIQNAHGGSATNGVLPAGRHVLMRDITDGTSNTLVVGEYAWDPVRKGMGTDVGSRPWTQGANGNTTQPTTYSVKNVLYPINGAGYLNANPFWFNDASFGSEHPGGAQFALGDGKVTFLSENLDMAVFRGLSSREDGEPVRAP